MFDWFNHLLKQEYLVLYALDWLLDWPANVGTLYGQNLFNTNFFFFFSGWKRLLLEQKMLQN